MAEKKTKKKKNPNVGILNNPLAQQYMASRSGQTIQGILPSLEQGGLGGFLRDVIKPFADLSAFGGEMVSLPGDLARRQLLTRNTEQRQGQRGDIAQMLGGGLMNTMQSPDMSMQEALGGGGDFRQAQRLLEERDSLLRSLEGRYNGTDGSLSPRYMTRQKFEDLQADPLTEASKYGATALSVVPLGLGGGIPAMALEGAISGGLGGYGAADRGQEMEGLTQGALFGGATGGVLGGLGKAFGKGGSKGSRAAERISDMAQTFKDGGVDALTNRQIKGLLKVGRSYGIEGSLKGSTDSLTDALSRTVKYLDVSNSLNLKPGAKGLASGFNKTGQEIDRLISMAPEVAHSVDDIAESIVDSVMPTMSQGRNLTREAAKREIVADLLASAKKPQGTLSLGNQDIANVVKALQDEVVSNKTSSGAELARRLHAETRGRLFNTIPDLKPVYEKRSILHAVKQDMGKKFNRGSKVAAPMLGFVRVPSFGAPEAIQRFVGKAQAGILDAPSLGGLGGLIGDVASNPAVRYAVPRAGYAMPTTEGTVDPAQMMDQMMQDQAMAQGGMAGLGEMGMGGMDTGMGMMGIQQPSQSSPQEVAQMVWQMYNSGMKPSDIKTMLTMTGVLNGSANGKPLPATQIETLSATRSSLQGLGELEQLIKENSSRFGVVQGGVLGDIAMSLGLDPERAYIQSKINTLAQTVGRALEGGVLREGDIARYRAMLPQLTDTPEAALQKLRSTIENIKASYGNLQQDFARAGYSVDGAAAPTMEDYVMQQY